MTAPGTQILRPGGGARLRRSLSVISVGSIVLIVLFLAVAIIGIAFLRTGMAVGAVIAIAYVLAALLSLRVYWVTRRTRAAVIGDAIDAATLAWAQRSSRASTRRAGTLALLIVAAGAVVSFGNGDIGQTLLAILGAAPTLSLASFSRSVARQLRRLPPP